MSHEWLYAIDGIDLHDICDNVRVLEERRADLRGFDRDIAWQEGQHHTPNKRRTGLDLALQCSIRYSDAAGAVTHEDGPGGHHYENKHELISLTAPGQHVLSRTAPHVGAEEIDVEAIIGPRPGRADSSERGRWLIIWHAAFPYWREVPEKTYSSNFTADGQLEVTVAGDVSVSDGFVTFEAKTQPVTNPRVELASTGRFLQYTDTIAVGESVEVDIRHCTATHSALGIVDRALSRGYADTFPLPRGTYTLDVSSDPGTLDYDVTVAFHDLRET